MTDDEKPIDPISFVRDAVATPLWEIFYHQERLTIAHQKLRFANEMIKRGNFNTNAERADVDDDDEDIICNVEQFALSILDDCQQTVEHHERALAQSHTKSAMAQIMLARGNYSEIDIEQIRAEQQERLAKTRKNSSE
jgi:hypothetical protein